jgi:hypothetical protein
MRTSECYCIRSATTISAVLSPQVGVGRDGATPAKCQIADAQMRVFREFPEFRDYVKIFSYNAKASSFPRE